MYGFDRYLMNNGFKGYIYDSELKRHLNSSEINGKTFPSSIGNIDVRFVKIGSELQKRIENKEEIEQSLYKNNYVIYGLSDHGLPPTLISPRPNIIRKTKVKKGYKVEILGNDTNIVNRYLKDTPHDKALQRIFDQKKIIWS